MNDRSVDCSGRGRDAGFLTLLVLLAVVWYLPRLGFYSDDWVFLGSMHPWRSSFPMQYAALGGGTSMRPVQVFLLAILHHTFGTNPLPFHLVNNAL
jgi:hypothetical protein